MKNKLKYLEEVELRIEEDVEDIADNLSVYKLQRNAALANQEQKGGIRVTKQMILDAAMSETCDEVTTVMLRDKKIKTFDDNFDDSEGERFRLEELCNVECIFASHNLIKDVIGIGQLTTLVELNLSFNMIEDISPLEHLTLLRALFMNHNKLHVIEPLQKLRALKQLGLFHNEIIENPGVMKTLESLPKLREVSVDGNPCAKEASFGYELILKLPKLRMLNEEAVKELDRDVAE